MKNKKRIGLLWLLLPVLFVAAALLIEFCGGKGAIPSWAQLHSTLGLVPEQQTEPLPQQTSTTVTFLDVGQGDAVLLEQDGEYCLIDAGPYDAQEQLCNALDAAGVETLRYLVMTHPHSDHIGGMPAILREYNVKTLIYPDLVTLHPSSTTLDFIRELAEEQGTVQQTAEQGMELPLGSGTLTVLLTGITLAAGDDAEDATNDFSLCLRFTAGGFSFLDTGDAEKTEEAALVQQYGGKLKSTLFKAGHHGSSTSNTEELLSAVQPQAVIVSCGLDNDYGHPHASVLRRYAEQNIEIYRTDLQGTVTAQWQNGALQFFYAEAEQPLAPAA